jgi:hypothetical protein
VSNRAPWLDPWQSAQLAQLGPWGDGQWGGIDPDDIDYGTRLSELAERYELLGDFLEAAAVAGHTSAIFEGIAMTIRAHYAWSVDEARADEIQGHEGDALYALDASAYRQLIMLLEDRVADVESRAAEVYRKPLADARGRRAQRRWALDCDARARRARQRAEMARQDNDDV